MTTMDEALPQCVAKLVSMHENNIKYGYDIYQLYGVVSNMFNIGLVRFTPADRKLEVLRGDPVPIFSHLMRNQTLSNRHWLTTDGQPNTLFMLGALERMLQESAVSMSKEPDSELIKRIAVSRVRKCESDRILINVYIEYKKMETEVWLRAIPETLENLKDLLKEGLIVAQEDHWNSADDIDMFKYVSLNRIVKVNGGNFNIMQPGFRFVAKNKIYG